MPGAGTPAGPPAAPSPPAPRVLRAAGRPLRGAPVPAAFPPGLVPWERPEGLGWPRGTERVRPLRLVLQVPGLLAPSSHNGPLVSAPHGSFPWLRLARPGEASYELPGRAASRSGLCLQPCGGGEEIIWQGQLLRGRGELQRDVWHGADEPFPLGSLLFGCLSAPLQLMPLGISVPAGWVGHQSPGTGSGTDPCGSTRPLPP